MGVKQEPTVKFATIRPAVDAHGLDELDIECRMSDGQKGGFIVVDADFPELAQQITNFLNSVPVAAELSPSTPSLCSSDRERVEWCVATVRAIADLGRDKPLGDLYPQAVMVCDALKRVLQPNIN